MRNGIVVLALTLALVVFIGSLATTHADEPPPPCPPGVICGEPTPTYTLPARQYLPLALRSYPVPDCQVGYICITATPYPTPRPTPTEGNPQQPPPPCPPAATCK